MERFFLESVYYENFGEEWQNTIGQYKKEGYQETASWCWVLGSYN